MKRVVSVRVEEELVRRVRERGINLSELVERAVEERIREDEGVEEEGIGLWKEEVNDERTWLGFSYLLRRLERDENDEWAKQKLQEALEELRRKYGVDTGTVYNYILRKREEERRRNEEWHMSFLRRSYRCGGGESRGVMKGVERVR